MAERLNIFIKALRTLENGVELYYEYEKIYMSNSTQENEQLYLAMRDSMIQRFKYTTNFLWKILQDYLEETEKVEIAIQSPRGIVRNATKVRFLSEEEGDECMKMVESRNKTSHLYHKEMAEEIAKKIPGYFNLLQKISDRLKSNN